MEHKFTDKNHPPVPQLKVGDICYAPDQWNPSYSHVTTCKIRRVDVKWREHDGGYWAVDYYIRCDINDRFGNNVKMGAYGLNDNEHLSQIFLTPQEVIEYNIKRFKSKISSELELIYKSMKKYGIEDKSIKMLEQLK